jgi:hypothetical protein
MQRVEAAKQDEMKCLSITILSPDSTHIRMCSAPELISTSGDLHFSGLIVFHKVDSRKTNHIFANAPSFVILEVKTNEATLPKYRKKS